MTPLELRKAKDRVSRTAWITVAAMAVLLGAVVLLGGCSVNQIVVENCIDYNETVVKGVLLPTYLESDASEEAKLNVSAAVAEHGEWLDSVRASNAGN